MNICAILLAAGSGSRFGGDKLLHPLSDGVGIGLHASGNLIAARLAVTAVVKPGDTVLAGMLEHAGCRVSVCPNAVDGMGASLAHGVAVTRDAEGWLIALADMPSIRVATITAIVAALEAGKDLVAPTFQGKRGHPVGLSARFREPLLTLYGDAGARAILSANMAEMALLECGDPGVLQDIDFKSDLRSTAIG